MDIRSLYGSVEEWRKAKQRRLKSSGEFLAKQLAENPAVADEWDGKKWSNLVAAKPEFADKCPWEKLDGQNWELLLSWQPQFADRCPWEKFDGLDWARVLSWQPQFADKCDWSKLTEFDWNTLLEIQPQFADRKPKELKPRLTRETQKGKVDNSRPAYVSQEVEVKTKDGKVVSMTFRDVP